MKNKSDSSKKQSGPSNDMPSESGSPVKNTAQQPATPDPSGLSKEEAPPAAEPNLTTETESEVTEHPPVRLEEAPEWAEDSKFTVAPPETRDETVPEREVLLPPAYGKPRLVFLVRDPYWMFVFWEIPPEDAHRLLAQLNRGWDQVNWVLRMYSPNAETAQEGTTWDTVIDPAALGWYLHLSPAGASFQGEIGLRDESGNFAGLTFSNIATLPPDRPSHLVDELWPISETIHDALYGGLPMAWETVRVDPNAPRLIESRGVHIPASRPNPFLGK